MTTYIISYDLRKVRNYDALYKAIKNYGTYAKILESLWAVKTSMTAKEVRDDLSAHMDSDDGLFVVKSWYAAAWRKVNCTDEWLKENL